MPLTDKRKPVIYVDADACPVKDETLRVAERRTMIVHYVSNAFMRLPDDSLVRRIVVPDGPDEADNWIVEHVEAHDIVITNDIPLAARCLEKHALVVGATGKEFTDATIGQALASRALNQHLRELGEMGGGGASFSRHDRSRFLQTLETLCRRAFNASGYGE